MGYVFVNFACVENKSFPTKYVCDFNAYYWGADVPDTIEGFPQLINLTLTNGDGPSTIKSSLAAAVAAKAVELGFTVANGDMILPNWQTG